MGIILKFNPFSERWEKRKTNLPGFRTTRVGDIPVTCPCRECAHAKENQLGENYDEFFA